jgi:predicted enzyme related to lactoylglutathione lyase
VTVPISYVELNSPDLGASSRFFADVFGWEPQPFAAADYLVAPHGDAPGVDSGLLSSRDGVPRTVPVIRVASIDATRVAVEAAGGTVVVEPFSFPGVGRGCYCVDPAGILFGLHEYDAD